MVPDLLDPVELLVSVRNITGVEHKTSHADILDLILILAQLAGPILALVCNQEATAPPPKLLFLTPP